MARFNIGLPPELRHRRSSAERSRRDESLEYGAWASFEGSESAATLATAERIPVFIEDRDFATANKKAPFAADAIVQSCLLLKDRMLTKRPNNKLVPAGSWALVEATGAVCPKLHESATGNCGTIGKPTDLQRKVTAPPC